MFDARNGIVVDFDEVSGLGHVEAEGELFRFHCIEIVDGSRSIAPGTKVSFHVAPRVGSYEAVRLETTSTSSAPR